MLKYLDFFLNLKNFKFTKKILNTCNKTALIRGLQNSLKIKLVFFKRNKIQKYFREMFWNYKCSRKLKIMNLCYEAFNMYL
jgi:hypothetical protein